MNRDCEYYEELMSRMADGELTEQEFSELCRHIRACPECGRLYGAFAAMDALGEDAAEPPADFAAGVMARIANQGRILPNVELPPAKKPRRRWPKLAAAACLVLIIGGSVFAAGRGRFSMGSKQYESIAMDAAAPIGGQGAAGYDGGGAMDAAEPEEAAPAEAAAPMEEYALDDEAMDMAEAPEPNAGAAAYSRQAPALVPEGSEKAFEALIQDAGPIPEMGDLHVIAAAEYHGVIYEFLSDEAEEYLLWQDAAEGYPVLSPAVPADLWDILA